jgi:cystathionine gamma-synthase
MSDSLHELPDDLRPDSLIVAAGRPERTDAAAVNAPISFTSTYIASPDAQTSLGYGRSGNETWTALESAISGLEGGRTLLFSSGMAAIAAVFALLPSRSVIVASRNGYTGTMYRLQHMESQRECEIRYVDIADTDQVLAALKGANFLWLESPTNPALEVADLPKIIPAAKALGLGVGVDNTFSTGLIQQPLVMGADISMNSVTKFMAGHSDLILGSLSMNDTALFSRLTLERKQSGAIPGAMEAWLALRGLRTLDVRLERAQKNALELATRLSKHSAVEAVRYPGLPNDPHHATAASFMKGFGAVISFEVKGGAAKADLVCNSSKLISHATSLGGVETLWERRHRWQGESTHISESLIRLSVGIENVEDLWADIEQALR